MARTEEQARMEAQAILDMTKHPGWSLLMARMDERRKDIADGLLGIMTKRPESLTGRKSMLEAGGLREIGSLLDWIEAEKKRAGNPGEK